MLQFRMLSVTNCRRCCSVLNCSQSNRRHTVAVKESKSHSARTGNVFTTLAAVVRHEAIGGVVHAIRAWFEYDTALSAVVQARTAYSLIHCSSAVSIVRAK